LLEAMSQGCIPVVTDIESGIPELIRDGVNGYRIPVGDIGGFAARLQTLQADPGLRNGMAAEAYRTLVGSCYEFRAMVQSYVRVFDQAVEAARSGAFRRPQGRIIPPPRAVSGFRLRLQAGKLSWPIPTWLTSRIRLRH